jgi:hypothetical protein
MVQFLIRNGFGEPYVNRQSIWFSYSSFAGNCLLLLAVKLNFSRKTLKMHCLIWSKTLSFDRNTLKKHHLDNNCWLPFLFLCLEGNIPCDLVIIGKGILFIYLFTLCWVGVHCGIYKSSYNISNISYLTFLTSTKCYRFSPLFSRSPMKEQGGSQKEEASPCFLLSGYSLESRNFIVIF